MPGGWIITYSNIREFRENKDFIVLDSTGEELAIEYDQDLCSVYNYYYEIWENCHEFGIPNGGDWTRNPPWLMSFIKRFNRIFNDIENYRLKRLKNGSTN